MKNKIKLTKQFIDKLGIEIDINDIPESQRYIKRLSSSINFIKNTNEEDEDESDNEELKEPKEPKEINENNKNDEPKEVPSCEGWISTVDIDSDGEIVLPSAINFERYTKNPIVLYNHNLDNLPIAKCTLVKITDLGIMAKAEFATHQVATDIYNMVKQGVLNTFSIGYIPLKYAKAGSLEFKSIISNLQSKFPDKFNDLSDLKQIVTECLMYEFSIVNVPSNQEAVILACKSLDKDTQDMVIYNKTIKVMEKDIEIVKDIIIDSDIGDISILNNVEPIEPNEFIILEKNIEKQIEVLNHQIDYNIVKKMISGKL